MSMGTRLFSVKGDASINYSCNFWVTWGL